FVEHRANAPGILCGRESLFGKRTLPLRLSCAGEAGDREDETNETYDYAPSHLRSPFRGLDPRVEAFLTEVRSGRVRRSIRHRSRRNTSASAGTTSSTRSASTARTFIASRTGCAATGTPPRTWCRKRACARGAPGGRCAIPA